MEETQRAPQYIELHEQVKTSINLLNSLEDFLSTFQKDLSSVSDQITDLQRRSKDIDDRLKPRHSIEAPLSNLLSTVVIPPELVTLILDTNVDEKWLPAIDDFQHRLSALEVQRRIRATKDLARMAEGLRIAATTKIRSFFLSLFRPIRTSMSTNMQVVQSSLILKYRPLYVFLKRHSSDVAQEILATYIAAARVYYETGFRRYTRNLGYIKTRGTDSVGLDSIVSAAAGMENDSAVVPLDEKKLSYSKINGEPVILGYMADDKTHVEVIEAVFRSLILVLMDNATAEYTFLVSFFDVPEHEVSGTPYDPNLQSPPLDDHLDQGDAGTERESRFNHVAATQKQERQHINNAWRQIIDPSLDHAQNLVNSVLSSVSGVISVLIMIRLLEECVAEVQTRRCEPLENVFFKIRLQFWATFQSLISENIESLNKLLNPSSTGYFSRRPTVTDALVRNVAQQYAKLSFSLLVLNESLETVVATNLNRLRESLLKLIIAQSKKAPDISQTLRYQSTLFSMLIWIFKKYRNDVQGTELYVPEAGIEGEITFWATKRANMQKDGSEPTK